MSNMSYCRYRNTLQDLRDCRDALMNEHDEDFDTSDDDSVMVREEKEARFDLVRLIGEMQEWLEENEIEESIANF